MNSTQLDGKEIKDEITRTDTSNNDDDETTFPWELISKFSFVYVETSDPTRPAIILNADNTADDFVYIGDQHGKPNPFFSRLPRGDARRKELMAGYRKSKRRLTRATDYKISYADACLMGDWVINIVLTRLGNVLRRLSMLIHKERGQEALLVLSHDNVYDIFEAGYEYPAIRACSVRDAMKLPLIRDSGVSSAFMSCIRTESTKVGERFMMIHVFRNCGKIARPIPSFVCLYGWDGTTGEEGASDSIPVFTPPVAVECAHCHVKLVDKSGIHCPHCHTSSYCGSRCMREHRHAHRSQCVTSVHWLYMARLEAEQAAVDHDEKFKSLDASVLDGRLSPNMKRFLYRFCETCHCILEKPKLCSRCQKACYCSVPCQSEHWPTHKVECKPIEKPTSKVDIHSLSSTK